MTTTLEYDYFLSLLKVRRSIRRLKPDPIPESCITMILEAAHYSMSGGNSQPWEVIVISDATIKKEVHEAYENESEGNWYIEQQRETRYRNPAFNVPFEERHKTKKMLGGWSSVPIVLAVLHDPRKQFGSVLKAQGGYSIKDVHASTMGHFSMTLQLAAASLGIGSQRVDVTQQTRYREILKYPEPLYLEHLVPIGYRAYDPGPPLRTPVDEAIHYNTYDMSKYLKSEDFLQYLDKIRQLGRAGYFTAIGEEEC